MHFIFICTVYPRLSDPWLLPSHLNFWEHFCFKAIDLFSWFVVPKFPLIICITGQLIKIHSAFKYLWYAHFRNADCTGLRDEFLFVSILEKILRANRDIDTHSSQMHLEDLLLFVHNLFFFSILHEAAWCLYLYATYRCLQKRKSFNTLGSVLFAIS